VPDDGERPKKSRAGIGYARLTRFYGQDCFPPGCSPHYRHFWLRESVPALIAQDRIESGEVSEKDIYDVAMVAFGDENTASALLTAKLQQLNDRMDRRN
jgi:hypothetical protein